MIFRGKAARNHLGGETLAVPILDLVDRTHAASADQSHDAEPIAEPVPD
jgi:hypothetical protein